MEDILLLNSIERYLEGRMLPDEKKFFEELRTSNPAIDQMVVEHKLFLHQMDEYADVKHFKESLHTIHSKLSITGEIRNSEEPEGVTGKVVQLWHRYKKVTAIAASIACITALFISALAMYFSPAANKTQLERLSRDIAEIKKSQIQTNNALKEVADTKIPKGAIVKSGGTAFLIDGKGFLVTNAHVLDGSGAIVTDKDGHEYKSKIVSIDHSKDLAVLQIVDNDYKTVKNLPYSIRRGQPDLGEELFTLGYPREEIVCGVGYLSAKTGYKGDTSSCQLSLTVSPGNSGAPVFSKNGEIIGIITTRQSQTEDVVFALKANNIYSMIDSLKSQDTSLKRLKMPSGTSLKNMDRVSQIKKAEDYVFLIKTYK
ncbi:S1 family peptidase [Parafilimonas terrae]|jgi:S1-C subfamily serine protease|uniref:Trypsin-like peptidase domain-containing protein n=1 Tax=Parafilimonas terrae TaxID=1465490 RepID=A0A1I5YWZ7_9BACT|nr:serine protease [Parafilimonas terrae]SFQ48778.1 Trypsin-like peptidase domain-containing protein [Parafilimonas terrae]